MAWTARRGLFVLVLLAWSAAAAHGQSVCDPDGLQASGSIYRICMPSSGYNGILVVWAHGFQDAGTPVGIPEDQLCSTNLCLPAICYGRFGRGRKVCCKDGRCRRKC